MKDYKKILEGIVNIINTTEKSDIGFANICAYIDEKCPELVESEDEKARKSIIAILNNYVDNSNTFKPKMIAWLEKQGEPTEINPSEFDLRLNRLLKQFDSLPKEELASSLSFYLNVVQNNGSYKEEKQGEKKPAFEMKTPEESLGVDSDTYNKIVDECIYGEQNPAWSEEDELRMENILSVIEGHGYPMEVEWLKSIKCKSTWKPSDVQLRALKEACDEHWEPDGSDPLYALYQNLKKLREE